MNKGNQLLKSLADSDKRVEYIDVASRMLNDDGTVRESLIGKDGVHMTREGYKLWADEVRSHVTR